MHEDIIDYIKSFKAGVSSKDLAEKFLKIKNPPEIIAQAAIYGILSGDKRCVFDESKHWHVVEIKELSSALALEKLPLSVVYLLCDSASSDAKVMYVAIWDVFPEPVYKWGAWFADPAQTFLEGVDMLITGPEEKFDSSLCNDQLKKLMEQLKDRVPVLFSYNEYKKLNEIYTGENLFLTSDNILSGELLRAASMQILGSQTLRSFSDTIFSARNFPQSVFRQGERLSECMHEMIKVLQEKGIRNRDDLDKQLFVESKTVLSDKGFAYEDIAKQASAPGVFGFKNRNRTFIYIGKSSNLKRSLLNYFRKSDELSEEDLFIQTNCYTFDAYQCGSELECLLFEHRLIKKHLPVTNKKIELYKEKENGFFIDDCIIILPHANPVKFMTLWFRKEQKALLKSFDLDLLNKIGFLKEIQDFFISGKLPFDNLDKLEFEIILRWIKTNEKTHCIIPVRGGVPADEIFETVKSYIKVLQEKRLLM
jgi:hypothetical protein